MDIAHPIKQECRIYIQDKILEAFNSEMNRKETEGDSYKPAVQEDLDDAQQDDSGEAPGDTDGQDNVKGG